MRKVAQHPKTEYATNYLDLLQSILKAAEHCQSLKDVTLCCIADMVNNQSLEFYPVFKILSRTLPPQSGRGWNRLLESCKQEILDLELGNRFFTFEDLTDSE